MNSKINFKAEDNKRLQRLLALNGIDNSNYTSRALNRSDMMRLFRITPEENKVNRYFDVEEFTGPIV